MPTLARGSGLATAGNRVVAIGDRDVFKWSYMFLVEELRRVE
jgi:hypothetical protein